MDGTSKAKVSVAGALMGALVASSCCLGPLLLSSLGVGGLGLFGRIGAARPYVLGVTALLVAGAFNLVYRRPKGNAVESCGCEPARSSRLPKVALWLSTAVIVLLALAPALLARVSERQHDTAPTSAVAAVLHVEGMDCEACAAPMRKALGKLAGFHGLNLDLNNQTVTVSYDPGPERPASYVHAINHLGYEARLLSPAPTGSP